MPNWSIKPPKMMRRFFTGFLLLLVVAGFFAHAVAAEVRPFARVQPLALGAARWTDGFWFDRFELCRTQMVPGMQRLMEGTNYSQFLRNYEIVAGLQTGRAHGAAFNDGDFCKFLEGATATLAITNDARLSARLDEIIAVMAKAQQPNGYLDTWVQSRQRETNSGVTPFRSPANWEVYNLGQLFTAASVHYRVTGQTNFLQIACRAADYLEGVFKHPTPELAAHDMCPSHYMGLLDLYRATGERRYLALAKKMFAMRDLVRDGTADNQDRLPFARQVEAEGHAVRANYLYAGATDLFLETGDTNLWAPLPVLWTNVVTEKMYVTGGCGALYDGASPDGTRDQKTITRVHQAYGRNFQLPNITAHNETCANIGNALWNWRMFLATGEARFMDVVELEWNNAVLAGMALDGTNFFYANPLRVTEPLPLALRWSRTRVPFVISFCCPPNLVRTLAESASYAYAVSANAIWVNLYGANSVTAPLASGEKIQLVQTTEYPWNGRVRIKILVGAKKEFALKLRIPGWAAGASVRVNGAPTDCTVQPESYCDIRREWRAGDFVDLDLPMPTRLLEANPLVEEAVNQVAIRRGPVVYCLESPDLPSDVKLSDVIIPADTQWTARFDQRLLGGIVVLEGKARARVAKKWNGKLYREFQPEELRSINLKLIPYSVWQNRGPSEMSVWLPVQYTP